jgi:purine nucleoside phosphorylase
MIAIIGGSSLSQLPGLAITHRQVVRTPYGEPSCALTFGLLAGPLWCLLNASIIVCPSLTSSIVVTESL